MHKAINASVLSLVLVAVACGQPRYRAYLTSGPEGYGADAQAIGNSAMAGVWLRGATPGSALISARWGQGEFELLQPLPMHTDTLIGGLLSDGTACGVSKPFAWEDTQPVLWPAGSTLPVALEAVLPGSGAACELNSGLRVAGYINDPGTGWDTAVAWNGTTGAGWALEFLSPLVPNAQALSINNLGDVVGWACTSYGVPHAVLWEDGEVVPIDLAPDMSCEARAHDIQDDRIIVGGLGSQPFRYIDGHWLYLPVDSLEVGSATAINDWGTMVGWVYHLHSGQYRAMLWERNLQPHYLDELCNSPEPLLVARDIADDGSIACVAGSSLDVTYGVLLVPVGSIPGGQR